MKNENGGDPSSLSQSWRERQAAQQPAYSEGADLDGVLAHLRRLPPLVTSWEVEALRGQLAEAAAGRRFLLQGGECAESLSDCDTATITARLKLLLQMSLVLIYGLRVPVVRVGRFAGQYAKPRSADQETQNGVTLPAYRGDIINRAGFTVEERTPDPRLMLDAYSHSAMTLNFVRALVSGGFADLHHPEFWNLDFLEASPSREEYRAIVDSVRESLRFMEAIGEGANSSLNRVDFYISHEALLLAYEDALTRHVPRRDGIYNLATHFPWIGLRTAAIGGAHIEYARSIRNPVAIKIGPDQEPGELKRLVRHLNSDNQPGRLTLIVRLGADRIESVLPGLIDAVQSTGTSVLWCADPMHGNTEITASGRKTRHFDRIKFELEQSFVVHDRSASILGGVHLELTGENVTECVGGASGVTESDLVHRYLTPVDPRLNGSQALEIAFSIVGKRKRAI
ncbi:MAG: 3-deoxy-7-phosphoheptulonate synthase class II [Bacteroidetes bacterium]|nr:3-deoxy-7-phosphoheptulonate synthase class II [Bacteroidota bacterium]